MYKEGHNFELQIDKVIKYINDIGYHAHKNSPQRALDGTFIKGEPFDYEAFLPDEKHCFDAKTCNTDSWQMKPKDIVQAENLKHCKNSGCEAYFLIKYKSGIKQVEIDKVINVLQSGKKSISATLGEEWRLLKKIGGKMRES